MATRNAVRPNELFCSEKWRLLDEFVAAAREIIRIQSRRAAAVTSGQEDHLQFDLPLQAARIRKDEALDAYFHHVEGHGC